MATAINQHSDTHKATVVAQARLCSKTEADRLPEPTQQKHMLAGRSDQMSPAVLPLQLPAWHCLGRCLPRVPPGKGCTSDMLPAPSSDRVSADSL